VFDERPTRVGTPRADLSAAVLFEAADAAHMRGARVLARVEQIFEWRDDGAVSLPDLRPPSSATAEVVWARPTGSGERVLATTAWRGCRRISCAAILGESDALGAMATAIAASRVAEGRAAEALVLGAALGRGYAILFTAPS
jgi:hypothetical protein